MPNTAHNAIPNRGTSGVIAVLACALLAAWIVAPIVASGGWYESNDGGKHLYRLIHFRASFLAGNLYPRWSAGMFGGYGYPSFVFYQPGYFFLTLPLMLVMRLQTACYVSLFLAVFGGVLGAYKLARLWNSRWLSLCFATVFILSPSFGPVLFVGGDLPEFYASLMCPWNAYFALSLARASAAGLPTGGPAAGLTATAFLIIITHPFVAFWWLPFVAGLIVASSSELSAGHRTLVAGGCCLGMAIALAAPYWLPAVQLIPEVATPAYAFALTGQDVTHTLANTTKLITGKSSAVGRVWLGRNMVTLIGFALTWRSSVTRYTAAMCLLYFYLISAESAWVWHMFYPVLKYMQYSSRIESPLNTIMYIGIVLIGPHLAAWQRAGASWYRACIVRVGAFAIAASVAWAMSGIFHLVPLASDADRLKTSDFSSVIYSAARDSRETGTVANEFLPKRARPSPPGDRPVAELVSSQADSTLAIATDNTPYRIRFELDLKGPGTVRINQLYFPGWKVTVNGADTPWVLDGRTTDHDMGATAQPTFNGFIRVDLRQAGQYRVEAWYDGPPGWQTRDAAIAVVVALLFAALWRLRGGGSPRRQ